MAKSPLESAAQSNESDQQARPNPLRAVTDVAGYDTVFLPGVSPSFILKCAATAPRVYGVRSRAIASLSGFHTSGCNKGFVYVDFEVSYIILDTEVILCLTQTQGILRMSQLPCDMCFGESTWPVRKISLGEEVHDLSYHPLAEVYILGTSRAVDFKLPEDDDFHHEWKGEGAAFRQSGV